MRVLKLKVLTQNELVKVETNVATFGELKNESVVKALDIDWSKAKLIDRLSKAEFTLDAAVLPAVDSVLFVMPTQSKAGADLSYKELKEAIKEYKANGGSVPFNYTQASTSSLNKFWKSVENSKNVVEEIQKETEENKAPCTEELETITLKPGKYVLVVEGVEVKDIEEIQFVDDTTLEDLEFEAQQLSAMQ